ncbi:MAG: hypothetical protein AABX03_01160 [Nanoarchaeota archaeon]
MTFTSLEIIALIFIIIAIIKLIVILINKKDWLPVIRTVYGNSLTSSIVIAILTIIVFYYLIKELSIVQIMAVAAFVSLLFTLSFLQFKREVLELAVKVYKNKLSPATWIYIIVWIALMAWALYEIFI